MNPLSGWQVAFLNDAVRDEADALPDDLSSKLFRYAQTIVAHGFEALPRQAVKPLGDKLWEFRMIGRDGIAREIYVTAFQRRVVIVRVFVKKTEKTPLRELKLAKARAKEVQ